MTITSIRPRKDGRYLVGLHFNQGTNLSKVMTAQQVADTKAKIALQQQQAMEYHALNNQQP